MLIAVLVVIIMSLGKVFRDRMNALVQGPITQRIQSDIFGNGHLHRYPMKIQ